MHRLSDDLSYCHVDGHPLFLDIGKDSYFRLSPPLERTFNAYLGGSVLPAADTDRLEAHGVLVAGPASARPVSGPITPARHSALELPGQHTACSPCDIAELFAIVCRTRFELRVRDLKRILEDRVSYRSRVAMPCDLPADTQVLAAAHTFLAARTFVPIRTCCLLDALSMSTFLSRRRLYARLVFGVVGDPFSAHCWVQRGDVALNDTVGNATAYTIIRVV